MDETRIVEILTDNKEDVAMAARRIVRKVSCVDGTTAVKHLAPILIATPHPRRGQSGTRSSGPTTSPPWSSR